MFRPRTTLAVAYEGAKKCVCVCGGGGGGGTQTRNLCTSGKEPIKRVVFGYMVIY